MLRYKKFEANCMYDFSVFDEARLQYSVPQSPFLDEHRKQVMVEKPYQGLKVLHNVPLTLGTVFKIEVLALGGAEVVATSIKNLPPEKRAIDILLNAKIRVQIPHKFNERFDFHLDCCGELLELPDPVVGAVELTQTGSKLYHDRALSYPVLSVDDSDLKVLETFFGTGDGFARALYERSGEEVRNKPFILFGYGKVGQGIVYALKKFTDKITVIDVAENPCASIISQNINYICASNVSEIKCSIAEAWCAITATGVKGLLTKQYGLNIKDFGSCILTNMGADDEYGDNFTEADIAFNKMPFNFSLEYPTSLHYLDPIFYSHNIGIDLILSQNINKGYNPFPTHLATSILYEWQRIYGENIDKALSL